MNTTDTCNVKRCRRVPELGYILEGERYEVCWRCCLRHCSNVDSFSLKAVGTLLLSATPILLIITRSLLEMLR